MSASEPARVLWVHQNFVTPKQAGNSRPSYIVAALLRAGLRLDVVTGTAGYLDDEPRLPAGVTREGALTIHRLPAGRRSFVDHRARAYVAFCARASAAVAGLLRQQRCDVIYASTPPLPQMLLALALAAWTGAPLVVEVRDLWPACLAEEGLLSSPLVLRALQWLEALLYRRADQLIAVAPSFADYLLAMGVAPERLHVIPTGGDPRLGQLSADSGARFRAQHGLEQRFLVLYTGSLNEVYAIDTLLAAAERLAARRPDIALVIAGNGRGRAQVLAAAARTPSIRYLGALAKQELLPALAAGDVGLVSLRSSRLMRMVCPGKLFDYLACGKPVLCTIDGQSGAIVRAAQAGVVVDAATPARLAAAIEQLADLSPAERRDLGARGQRWMAAHLDAATMGQRVADVVQGCVGRRRGRGGALAATGRDAALALLDVVRGRAARALAALFAQPDAVERSFQRWLGQATAPATPPDELVLPSLISDSLAAIEARHGAATAAARAQTAAD